MPWQDQQGKLFKKRNIFTGAIILHSYIDFFWLGYKQLNIIINERYPMRNVSCDYAK